MQLVAFVEGLMPLWGLYLTYLPYADFAGPLRVDLEIEAEQSVVVQLAVAAAVEQVLALLVAVTVAVELVVVPVAVELVVAPVAAADSVFAAVHVAAGYEEFSCALPVAATFVLVYLRHCTLQTKVLTYTEFPLDA